MKGHVYRKQDPTTKAAVQDLDPIQGARVQALLNGVIQAVTLTDKQGHFQLELPHGDYQIRVTAPNGKGGALRGVRLNPDVREHLDVLISNQPDHGDLGHDHACCHGAAPRQVIEGDVFLAAVTCFDDGSDPCINESETNRLRQRVYTNPVLGSLLLDHLNDQNNPHGISAADLGVVGSINEVEPEFGEEGGNLDLVCPNETLLIHPKPDEHKILIGAIPAEQVKGVAATESLGCSPRFAREDHVHSIDHGP